MKTITTKKALVRALRLDLIDVDTYIQMRRQPLDVIIDVLDCCGFVYSLSFDKNGLLVPQWEV